MEFIEELIGVELGLPARFLAAFVIVLALIAITAAVIRMLANRRPGRPGGRGNRRNRLSVGEWIAVDEKRRLILVRRDDVEHLLLVGGESDLVVERDTAGSSPATRAQSVQMPMSAPVPDVLEPPAEPKHPAIDLSYRSPLRTEPTLPQAAPASPGPRSGTASATVPAATAVAATASDADFEDAASRAVAEVLDMAKDVGNAKSEDDGKTDNLAEALQRELSGKD